MQNPSTQAASPPSFNISFFDIDKARKNRSHALQYVVGYARLSFDEDGDNFCSIENQRSILEDIYRRQFESETSSFTFIADDNVSGYKFERPGLYKLLSMIEAGKCNVIIAKDLSRIGRHSALTQLFIEQCERAGVRVHAMSDYDTNNESDDLILGIRAWSNERVVKDASAKINKVIRHKQENGTWFCAAPFGYSVLDYESGKVRIEEEEADIVRRIFDMYIGGIGVNKIAQIFTKECVPTPNTFARNRAIAEGKSFKKPVSGYWTGSNISSILSNEFYIGTLITRRYRRDGINGKDVRTDESEWVRFPNHHEAIISQDVFKAAKERKESNKRFNYRQKGGVEHLFHGLIYCGECGAVEYAYSRPGLAMQYICSNHFRYGKSYCSRHRIKESLLIDIAMDYLKIAKESCLEIIASLDGELFSKSDGKPRAETITKLERELEGIDHEMYVIEEQRIKQIIAHPERESGINPIYDAMIATAEQKRGALTEKIARLKKGALEKDESIKRARSAVEIIDQIIESGKITRQGVVAIFNKIIVHENGNIEVELKPYLHNLSPPPYKRSDISPKQPILDYIISTFNSFGANIICDGSPSRMRSVRRISLGITTRPSSSILRTMPVALIMIFLPEF